MPTNPHIPHQRAVNTLRELIAALAPIAQDGEHSAAYINARLREVLRDVEASEVAWRAHYEQQQEANICQVHTSER